MAISIIDILERLSDPDITANEHSIKEELRRIWDYYKDNGRHSYSEISEYVIKKFSTPKDGEIIEVIAENIEYLIGWVHIKRGCKCDVPEHRCIEKEPPNFNCAEKYKPIDLDLYCSDYEQLYILLKKLLDHVKLEFVRTSEARIEREQYNLINTESKEELESLRSQIDYSQEVLWRLEESTKNQSLQVVSILGIFAAIVIAVFGGLNVINSISSAFLLGNITIYRTILVAAMCTLFVIWVIYALLGMVRWFRFRASPTWFSVVIFSVINVVCLAGIIFALIKQGGS